MEVFCLEVFTMVKEKRFYFWATVGLFLVGLFWLSGKAVAETSAPNAWDEKEFIQVKVHRLVVDPATMQPVVFLADPLEERAVPMWIGPCEAEAINGEMHGIKHPRPLTHDLLEAIIQKMNGKIRRVAVTHNKEGVYYATLTMEMGTTLLDIDARPSDSIVMALKFKAPVYVSKSLFSELSVPLTEPKEKKPATPIKL